MQEVTFKQKIHLAVPEVLHGQVKEAARSEGQTASEFIRQAIRAQLRRTDAVQTQPAAGD